MHEKKILIEICYRLQRANLFTPENISDVYNYPNPRVLSNALLTLENAEILTAENYIAVYNHVRPNIAASALCELNNAGILTPENLKRVCDCYDPDSYAGIVCRLHDEKLDTETNIEIVCSHSVSMASILAAMLFLQDTKILNQENFNAVCGHNNPSRFALALSILHNAEILTDENRKIVRPHIEPNTAASALCKLHEAGLCSEPNIKIVCGHSRASIIADILISLHTSGILTAENLKTACQHHNPENLERALDYLRKAAILTQANFEVVAFFLSDSPRNAAITLICLHQANILTDENRKALINHPGLITSYFGSSIQKKILWQLLPPSLLDQNVFTRLIEITQGKNMVKRLEHYLKFLLNSKEEHSDASTSNPESSISCARPISQANDLYQLIDEQLDTLSKHSIAESPVTNIARVLLLALQEKLNTTTDQQLTTVITEWKHHEIELNLPNTKARETPLNFFRTQGHFKPIFDAILSKEKKDASWLEWASTLLKFN